MFQKSHLFCILRLAFNDVRQNTNTLIERMTWDVSESLLKLRVLLADDSAI